MLQDDETGEQLQAEPVTPDSGAAFLFCEIPIFSRNLAIQEPCFREGESI